jgi:signal transduction histidine kinase/CheY-like chemotaxis protein
MSLRSILLLLYGLILGILAVALAGFYWAVERSLTDQQLLRVARVQLQDTEAFSARAHGQVAETGKLFLLNTSDPRIIRRLQEDNDTSIQRLIDVVHTELTLLKRYNNDGSETREWKLENEELNSYLRIQELHRALSEKINSIIAQRKQLTPPEVLAAIRECDDILYNRLSPVLSSLHVSETEEMLSRETTMLDHTHLFERLAIGTCLATLVVVLTGTYFLRRALTDLAKKEAAAAADRAKSEFLANMSHEIRTPMTAILGFTDILTQGVTDPERIKTASIVKRNGEHLLDIINDILDLAKLDAGQVDVVRESCSPSQIVTDVATLMQVRAAAKKLELKVEFDGKIPETIQSSPLRLRQILINLVGNAVKFTETGTVQLVTRLIRDENGRPKMQFDVIDTGVGISQENISKLFHPFTQVDSSRTKTIEGTGLGLAISRRLANMLGGDIGVASVAGQGSTFSATAETGPLEGVKMLEPREASQASAATSAPAAAKAPRPKLQGRILLVEDGPDNQRLISFFLRRAGAEVTLADNGIVAMEIIQEAMRNSGSREALGSAPPFDLILMDMQMPLMDGYEVTQRLRAMGYRLPIVALTAYAMSTDRQKCLDAGCDDYATKPISEAILLQTLATHLRKQPTGTPAGTAEYLV